MFLLELIDRPTHPLSFGKLDSRTEYPNDAEHFRAISERHRSERHFDDDTEARRDFHVPASERGGMGFVVIKHDRVESNEPRPRQH